MGDDGVSDGVSDEPSDGAGAGGTGIARYLAKGFEKDENGYYPKSREAILVRWSVWAAAVFFGMAMAQLVFGVFLR